jgi:hypothetical protein
MSRLSLHRHEVEVMDSPCSDMARVPMPWDELNYPPAMAHLPPPVRRKAIEIANALLADGHDEGFASRVAIARAKEWERRREIGPM